MMPKALKKRCTILQNSFLHLRHISQVELFSHFGIFPFKRLYTHPWRPNFCYKQLIRLDTILTCHSDKALTFRQC